MEIKLVVSDIDGVWTDGGMYYQNDGNEIKKFSVYDGAAVLLLRKTGIPVCIVTGEETKIVERRAKKLKIDYIFQGCQRKHEKINALCKELSIRMDQVAYIGDDFNDVAMLKAAGISATPANASDYIKSEAKWVLNKKGGEGAFREFVERILDHYGLLEQTIAQVKEDYA